MAKREWMEYSVGRSLGWCVNVIRHHSCLLIDHTLGIIAPVTSLTSADSICHIAEELEDAAKWLPRCMVGAASLIFTISFLLLLIVLFRAGDITEAINSPTGQPYIDVLLNATQHYRHRCHGRIHHFCTNFLRNEHGDHE